MAEKVDVVVDISVSAKDAGASVKSIKTELREAKAEAIEMARRFGDSSVQATNAAKKVAGLKDEIEDLGIKIKGVNPDKFARLASMGQGVAQGFVAAQGAMALFGGESKDLEKTMIKLQGAIALSQGLQGLKDTKLAFGGLGTTIKEGVVSAFTTLKGAIAATGIGLIVILVAALVANWKEFSSYIEKTFPSLKKITDFFNNFKQIAAGTLAYVVEGFKIIGQVIGDIFSGDFSKAIEDAKSFGQRTSEAYNKAFEEKDRELKILASIKDRKFKLDLLEAEGKDVSQARLKMMRDELSILEKGSEEYNTKLIDIEKFKTDLRNKANEAKVKADKEAAEKKKIADDKALQLQRDQLALENEIFAASDKEDKDRKKVKEDEFEANLLHEFDLLEQSYQAKSDLRKKEKKDEEDLQKAKFQFVKDSLTAISDLVYLFEGKSEEQHKRAFEIQKALSIAQTIISTIESAQAAYKNALLSPLSKLMPDGGISLAVAAAVIATAAGLARIKQIKSTTYQSTTTPTSPSTGGGINPPITATTPQQQRNIVGNATGSTGTQTQTNDIRVYVTEGDISRTQGRVGDIKRRAVVH